MNTDVHSVILSVYREILGQPRMSPDDDFFDLGGDSMQAIEAAAIIGETVGEEIPFAWFFTCRTAAELADMITGAVSQRR